MSISLKITLATALLLAACAPSPANTPAPRPILRFDQVSGTNALLIAVSPVNSQVVWVSGAQGTFARTIDGGTTWRAGRVFGADSLQFRDVHAVDANTAYLLSIGPGDQSRIYKTTDAGQSWTLQFSNTDPKGFYDCMSFWDPIHGITIGDAVDGKISIITTTDGGTHWTAIPPSTLPPAQPSEGSFAASGTCLVTQPGGHAWIAMNNAEHARVLHTPDFGRTWSMDTLPITTRDGVGAQSLSFRDGKHGVALGGGYGALPGDVLSAVTSDGGSTWSPRARPPLASGVWGGGYVPGSTAIVAVGPKGAVFTRNEGASWIAIDTMNYWSVGFASPDAGWAVGLGGRITRLGGF